MLAYKRKDTGADGIWALPGGMVENLKDVNSPPPILEKEINRTYAKLPSDLRSSETTDIVGS